MYEQEPLPLARQEGLLHDAVGEELLLYDQNSHTAHCLSPLAASVWRHCNGERDVADLALLAGVSESLVVDALLVLREKDLLDATPALTQSATPGESRREAIIRVGRYGAAAAGASMIVSASAATPAMAETLQCCQCFKPGGNTPCECENGFSGDTPCERKCQKNSECETGNLRAGKCNAAAKECKT